MARTLRGKVRGKTIELDKDPGEADGQEVEIQIKVVDPGKPRQLPMNEGLVKVYEILGRRHGSCLADTAQRHNEHQP